MANQRAFAKSDSRPAIRRASGILTGFSVALLTTLPLVGTAQAADLVLIDGVAQSRSVSQGRGSTAGGMNMSAQGISCSADPGDAMSTVNTRVAELLASYGVSQADLNSASFDVSGAVERVCEDDDAGLGAFRMIYAECRVTMHQGAAAMDMRIPGSGAADLRMIDYSSREVTSIPMGDNMAPAAVAVEALAQGATADFSALGDSRRFESEHLPVTVRNYSFDSRFSIDIAAMMSAFGGETLPPGTIEMMSGMIGQPAIVTTGTAWLAADVDGLDTIRAFYERFAGFVDAGQGTAALMLGMYNPFAVVEGMPLDMTQTTTVEMARSGGLLGGLGAMMPTPEPTTTRTVIDNITVLPMPAGYCDQEAVLEGFAVSSLMSSAEAGPGGAPGAPGGNTGQAQAGPSAEDIAAAQQGMAEALSGLNEALENMSDEDREALEQFTGGGGFGGLLRGAQGGRGGNGSSSSSQPTQPSQ